MIEIALPGLEAATESLKAFPGGAQFAISRTVKDVAGSGKAAATQFIFTRYQFDSQGPIQRGITITTRGEFSVIRFQGSRFKIAQFLPSRTDTGIDFMEIRGQRSTISQAFGSIMKYGFGIFKRKTAARGPVQSQTGLSIANMARESTEIMPEMTAHVRAQLEKRLKFWVAEVRTGNRAKYERKSR